MYTKEELLKKLNELLEKYGKIQTKLIDKEPNFPTRKCFVNAFGSVENACYCIGYYDYKKGAFDITDAQKVLDKRNNNFDLLSFCGMRSKNLTKCRTCGYEWEVVTDNLLRNNTRSHGCPNCSNHIKEYPLIIEEEVVKISIEDLESKYPKKQGYGYIYKITNLINNKKYIGSTIFPYERWRSHIHAAHLNDNPCYNYPLQKGIRKYGVNNFVFEIIREDIPIKDLKNIEREMIILYNSLSNEGWGYNQTLDTECPNRENKWTKSSCACALVDKNNNILKTFTSYHNASFEMFGTNKRASNIRRVCKGVAHTLHGYVFRDLDKNGNVVIPK